mmetsp:Transcript_15706/g.36489  ORF Transcript_15706/g.36489 Transcript_15706/m.36489 type:complete len:188 (+) Transcript_15706:37-600(+)
MDALDFSSDSEDEPPRPTKGGSSPTVAPQPAPLATPSAAAARAAALLGPDPTGVAALPHLLDEPEDLARQTALQNRWVFWFMHRGSHKGSNTGLDNFEQALIPVASFQTVEHFWRVYDHVARPGTITGGQQTTYHLFKQGIKPTWEDPNNCRGGAWIVRLRKGLAARFWEELLLAVIGEGFDVGNEV